MYLQSTAGNRATMGLLRSAVVQRQPKPPVVIKPSPSRQAMTTQLLNEHPGLHPRVADEAVNGALRVAGAGGAGGDVVLDPRVTREVSVHTGRLDEGNLGRHLRQEAQQAGVREIYLQVNSPGATTRSIREAMNRVQNGVPDLAGIRVRVYDHQGRLVWQGNMRFRDTDPAPSRPGGGGGGGGGAPGGGGGGAPGGVPPPTGGTGTVPPVQGTGGTSSASPQQEEDAGPARQSKWGMSPGFSAQLFGRTVNLALSAIQTWTLLNLELENQKKSKADRELIEKVINNQLEVEADKVIDWWTDYEPGVYVTVTTQTVYEQFSWSDMNYVPRSVTRYGNAWLVGVQVGTSLGENAKRIQLLGSSTENNAVHDLLMATETSSVLLPVNEALLRSRLEARIEQMDAQLTAMSEVDRLSLRLERDRLVRRMQLHSP